MSASPQINSTFPVRAESEASHEVEHVLAAARQELQHLLEQRSVILRRIATVRRTINGLMDTFGGSASGQLSHLVRPSVIDSRQKGLTSACRTVLHDAVDPLTAVDVVERVLRSNPRVLGHHKNSISSVTTVLRRLQAYGEAASSLSTSGQRVWSWRDANEESMATSCQLQQVRRSQN